jgi:cytochrome c553
MFSGWRRIGEVVGAALGGLLALPLLAAEPPPHAVPDTMAQRMMACTLCHGNQGRATSSGYFPRIAGKPAGYLYNQLTHFRDGRRQNPGMANLLDHLSEAYLREIADYFAAIDLPYPPPQAQQASAAAMARAEILVRQGDAALQVPACVACHGKALTGVKPAVPGLLGLPRDYLIGQLGAWQTGLRQAHAPDCMAQIARALPPEDVSAVAAWLSSRALPADTRPAPTATQAMPIRCGSALP